MRRNVLHIAVAMAFAVVFAGTVGPLWSADVPAPAAPATRAAAPQPTESSAQKVQISGPAGANQTVTLNLINTEIEGVIKVVGELTGKNFVLDPRVKGTITVVSAKP